MIVLRPWAEGDWPLLVRLNTPEMTDHLGGPESDVALSARHERYLAAAESPLVFPWAAVLEPEGVAMGSVTLWEREWHGRTVYEMGWAIVPEYQGRGLATAAVKQAVELTRGLRRRNEVHAFPSVENAPSNSVCRKAGFELIGPVEFEYPKRHWMSCNDWQLSLR